MAIPSTGPVRASDINAELGRSPTAQLSMNDAVVRALAGVPSGTISYGDFQGRQGDLIITPTGNYSSWTDGTYSYISWMSSGSISVEGVGVADVLLQAGGGGGGAGRWTGGGGAGGCVITTSNIQYGTYAITVGGGGGGMPYWPGFSSADPSGSGTRGGDSVFNGIVAKGGGAQKSYTPGGSGAGASFSSGGVGSGTTGQGFPGGAALIPSGPTPASNYRGGGGGGIIEAGASGGPPGPGKGGRGTSLSQKAPGWTAHPGIPYYSAWGGGGSGSQGWGTNAPIAYCPPIGYGAGGFTSTSAGSPASTYSGSGGGSGGFNTSANYAGGAGASGFVAIRFIGTIG